MRRAALAAASLLAACASAPTTIDGSEAPVPRSDLRDVGAAAWVGSDLVALVAGPDAPDGSLGPMLDTVVRLREDGHVVWSTPLPGGPTELGSIAACDDGDLLVAGHAAAARLDPLGLTRWIDRAEPAEQAWQQVTPVGDDILLVGHELPAFIMFGPHRWGSSCVLRWLSKHGGLRWSERVSGYWAARPVPLGGGQVLLSTIQSWGEVLPWWVTSDGIGPDAARAAHDEPWVRTDWCGVGQDAAGTFLVTQRDDPDQRPILEVRSLQPPPGPGARHVLGPPEVVPVSVDVEAAARWRDLLVVVGGGEAFAIARDGLRWRCAVFRPTSEVWLHAVAVRVDGPGSVVVAWSSAATYRK